MGEELVIDAHIHTYPRPEIGLQAMQGAGQSGCTGTIEEIISVLQKNRIVKAVMVNVTPVVDMLDAAVAKLPKDIPGTELARQVDRIKGEMIARMIRRNAWTCAVAREHPELVPFFSVDPLMDGEAMIREIDERVQDGGRGLKLHPSNCRFFPNDRRLWPAYRRCEEIGLPVINHAGIFGGDIQYAEPKHFAEVLAAFPQLTMVLAHMGRPYWEQVFDLVEQYPNVCLDTSTAICGSPSYAAPPADEAVKLIRRIGVDRVMFGTDWPWFDPGRDLEFLRTLDLSEGERRAILGENAVRILKLE